ncbi:hypothetical protein QTP86_017242 [Hemibagrus guttatus]|nr:hypothetical protein QTP86_017242 [Hemibagrus guttatus]
MRSDSAVAVQSSLPSNQAEVEVSERALAAFSPVEKLRQIIQRNYRQKSESHSRTFTEDTQVSARVLARLGDMSSQMAAHHPVLKFQQGRAVYVF